MKRILAALVILPAFALLTSCSQHKESTTTAASTTGYSKDSSSVPMPKPVKDSGPRQ
jgi:uncharacterized lipoprotein YajG